jgi:hypothetical protein
MPILLFLATFAIPSRTSRLKALAPRNENTASGETSNNEAKTFPQQGTIAATA